MYEKFFGFSERPFQLVPNPTYLFLSKSHEEALAHLTYAVSQGDGFVKITGEVGTGKTTLCRVFLDNLDDQTEAAYILNPMLSAADLLKAINDEFDIPSDADESRPLIDTLNAFLMEKKREGKQVILLIDEAQNLSRDVLEQLRLLSNLETNTSKLLQIILVGQPELREKLDSHELRQLSQRITLSCHLKPLDFRETGEYIRHRIRIASRKMGVRFTRSAHRAIYRYSGGIPRLINIVCDRAMLTAYGLNKHKISGYIAREAIRELAGKGDTGVFGRYGKTGLILGLILLMAGASVFYFPRHSGTTDGATPPTQPSSVTPPETASPPGHLLEDTAKNANQKADITPGLPHEKPATEQKTESAAPAVAHLAPASETAVPPVTPPAEASPRSDAREPEPAARPAPPPVRDLGNFLSRMELAPSRRTALRAAITPWQTYVDIKASLDHIEDDPTFFRLAARQNTFSLQRVRGDLNQLIMLNLPTVLTLYPEGSDVPGYLALTGADTETLILSDGRQTVVAGPEELNRFWSGVAYTPWKNFLGITGTIPRNASADSIITLKMILQDIGFRQIEITPVYNDETRQAVRQIQERNGVTVDGAVGPMTKIILYNEIPSLTIPHLSDARLSASGREGEN
ncbi:peptidoglycan-binding protein [Desulfonema ishimotonii]|uniref:Peptidoglycan-binding protein n=1 Tax=Desulfonema ishimotonii TaxID=45657 RepID=A0A401FQN5_9BACT|nr:ExeA family protein [Desulfonema ishimotonii]GBC59280.1 peptidoglycan-binding protein [Desulfonema ishimotonii]